MRALFTLLALTALALYALGCDSGESEDAQPGPTLDVDGGLGPVPEAGPEAAPDAATVPEAAATDGPVDKPSTSICADIGKVDGETKYTTVYFKGPLVQGRYLALAGYLKDANYAEQNAGFGVWCWGGADKDEIFCRPPTKDGTDAIAYPGSGLVVAPGHTATATETDFAQWKWYCEKDSCPVGTFVACSGKDEVCRIENGVKSGTADYEKNEDGWSNVLCTFK